MTNVIELVKQAGALRYTNRHYPDRPTHTFTVEQLELYTKLVRNAALEEAVDELKTQADYSGSNRRAFYMDAIAHIRNLKEPTP